MTNPVADPHSLGNLLVKLGYCTKTQVDLAIQRLNGKLIGERLIEMGALTENQLDWALTFQAEQRHQINGKEMQAYVTKQRLGLVHDLQDITKSVKHLTAKIHPKIHKG